MKKKYVAVILGLVLSMSTASVYAAGEKTDGEPPQGGWNSLRRR